ncbi:exosome complex component RRP43-like isoform X2 [Halichondria panicea]|uniref:exosome complex component RRP43-like isoform X2 n=1 Tax=Halichondria panicea TaxID=6063 RepID=UPI00312B54A5
MADQSSEEAARLHKFVDPVSYLSAFVSNGVRPDGRSCSTARNVTLNIGSISTANGSAMVKLGQTCVLAAVKMELSNPPLECPSRGYLVCNIDQSSSSLSEALSGPPTSEAQSLSQTLQDLLSRFVDCDDLILVESKLCWTVYVDVVCLCNSGNVWDACVLASTVALINSLSSLELFP